MNDHREPGDTATVEVKRCPKCEAEIAEDMLLAHLRYHRQTPRDQ